MLNQGLVLVRGARRRPAIAAIAVAVLGVALTGFHSHLGPDLQTERTVARLKQSKRPAAAFPPDSYRPVTAARLVISKLGQQQKIVLPLGYAEVLRSMLHMEDVNSVVARMNLRALLRVPLPLLRRLKEAGVLIFISARPVPENADLGSMRGVKARGHGAETWDQIEGTYVPDRKFIVAGGVPGMDALSGSSLPHELGHAVAHSLGYLNSRALIEAHQRVFGQLPAYERQGGPGGEAGRDEMYAETVGVLIAGSRGKAVRRTDERFVKWLEASLGLGRSRLAGP